MTDQIEQADDQGNWLKSIIKEDQATHRRVVGSWKKLYLSITDEMYAKEAPALDRLKVLKIKVDDFLLNMRDKLPLVREAGDVDDDIVEDEKDYIEKFEQLGNAIRNKLDVRQSSNVKKPEEENPHPFIFPNRQCWELFNQSNEDDRYKKATYCFLYWQMKKDGFMNDVTPKQYKDWLLKELNFDMGDYWKQLYRISGNRLNEYKKALHRIKP